MGMHVIDYNSWELRQPCIGSDSHANRSTTIVADKTNAIDTKSSSHDHDILYLNRAVIPLSAPSQYAPIWPLSDRSTQRGEIADYSESQSPLFICGHSVDPEIPLREVLGRSSVYHWDRNKVILTD
jgi:hypothetical protein